MRARLLRWRESKAYEATGGGAVQAKLTGRDAAGAVAFLPG